MRVKTIKLLKENTGENLSDFRFGKGFINRKQKAQIIQEKN